MIRSFVFQNGKLLGQDIELIQLQTLLADPTLMIWVDLDNPAESEWKTVLEDIFKFHPLAIEDCISISQTPKVDDYETYLYMVIHAVDFSRKTEQFSTTELDFFLGKNFVVTYHREPLHSITSTMDRCKKNPAQVARASDRLAHTILDALVDNYTPVLNELTQDITEVEEQAFTHPQPETLTRVQQLRKEVANLRTIISPQSEVISRFARGEYKEIRPHLVPYYKDIYDHLHRIAAMAENYRDALNNVLLIYQSSRANETNAVIKVLTFFTVISTPVTIVGTWYGMNFHSMPEINWEHGYVYVVCLTLCTTLLTIWYFKYKKWF
ncbi:MAG: magnesium/cobalt transporter CorA [Verrucomicrobiae bacterium]|nr:magnesium/cobalt transporter CorA [Verrucomicrobiae bacterium]